MDLKNHTQFRELWNMKQMNSLVLGEIKSKKQNAFAAFLMCCILAFSSCGFIRYVMGPHSTEIPVNVVASPDSLHVKTNAAIFEAIMNDESRTKVFYVGQHNEGPKEFSIDRTRIDVQVNGSKVDKFHYAKLETLLKDYYDWHAIDSTYVIRPNEQLYIEVEANVSVGDSIRIVERNVQAELDSLVLEMVVPKPKGGKFPVLHEGTLKYDAYRFILRPTK